MPWPDRPVPLRVIRACSENRQPRARIDLTLFGPVLAFRKAVAAMEIRILFPAQGFAWHVSANARVETWPTPTVCEVHDGAWLIALVTRERERAEALIAYAEKIKPTPEARAPLAKIAQPYIPSTPQATRRARRRQRRKAS
jgi:hypothetical protein